MANTVFYVIVSCKYCDDEFMASKNRYDKRQEYCCPYCYSDRYTEIIKTTVKTKEKFYVPRSWFTEDEDDYLWESRKREIPYKKISEEMNRSVPALKRRMCVLRGRVSRQL